MEIVEHVLLLAEHAIAVPLLALLAAAPEIRDRPYATGCYPREDRRGVAGRHRDAEAAVAVEHRRPGSGRGFVRRHDEHPNYRAVLARIRDDARVDLRDLDGARGAREVLERTRAGIELVDLRHRRVIGVDEPGERAAGRVLDRAGEGADAGQVDRADERAVGRSVHRKLAHPVPRPHDEEEILLEAFVIEDRGIVEHGIWILGDEIDPVLGRPVAWRRDGDPAHRRIAIGAHEDASVASERQ